MQILLCECGYRCFKNVFELSILKGRSNKLLQNPFLRSTSTSSTFFIRKYKDVKKFKQHLPFSIRCLSTAPIIKPTLNGITKDYFYQNAENQNAETYLRKTPGYANTFFNPTEMLVVGAEICQAVIKFTAAALNKTHTNESITAQINKEIIEDVLSNLKLLKTKELFAVLYNLRYFHPCSSSSDPAFMRIWSKLDEECVFRMTSWSMDSQFVVADLWWGLKLVRFSKFHKNLIAKCLRICDTLKKEHFMRFMYCLNLTRTMPTTYAAYDIENYLGGVIKCLNSHEVCIIAMAFFKTSTALKDQMLLESLLKIVIDDNAALNSIEIAAVAKFARLSSSMKSDMVLYNLQEAFLPNVDQLSIMACTHLALISTRNHFPCMALVNASIKRVFNDIQEARLKELERMALAMTMFDADCDELGHRIVEELRAPSRLEEIKEYGRCLPAILHYLSMREIFPTDLIDYVLGDSFRKTYYGNISENYQRELLCLDFCAELEIPDYQGSRLEKHTRERLLQSHVARVLSSKPNRATSYEASVIRVSKTMESLLGGSSGSEFVHICNLLPQHQSIKIVFCTDNDGKPIKVPRSYRILPEHQIKFLEYNSVDCNIKFHVLYLCNRNDVIEREKRLTGPGKMQVRQLTKMGYFVSVVFPPFNSSVVHDVLQNSIKLSEN